MQKCGAKLETNIPFVVKLYRMEDNESQDSTAARRSRNHSLVVRPFGYVEDRPIIRRVGSHELFIGNHHAGNPERHDHSFRYVLSATEEPLPLTTHHCPLLDGPGNDWSAFKTAVDTSRRLHRQDGSVLIHCKAGISRSSTLLATTLAAEENQSFRAALDLVQQGRPSAMPHPSLHKAAIVYLASLD